VSIDELARVDGRRARRERNRAAVIDALLSLIDESHVPPSADDIAQRAGVSVSSLFRYFESLDDLQEQTIERHYERFAPLYEIAGMGVGSRADRIDRLVDARITLYRSIAPVARLARSRSLDNPRLAERLAEMRSRFSRQIRDHFAPELATLPRADGNDLVVLLDTLTSFESWDIARTTRGYSERLLGRAWTAGVAGIGDRFLPAEP
jgi:TetR/AcrR family transcriptional regulator of autoinduction and epiphytic fitness